MIINYLIYILFPIYLLIAFWRNKNEHVGMWALYTLFVGSCLLSIFVIGAWPLTFSYYLRYFIIFVFFLFFAISLFRIKNRPKLFQLNIYSMVKIASRIFFAVYFTWLVTLSINSYKIYEDSVELDFPLKGSTFYIAHGGNGILINHHHSIPAQKYAIDILELNKYGMRSKNLIPQKNHDYNIYESIVFSPCNGTIVDVANAFKDQNPGVMDSENLAGNYIIIKKTDSNVCILLAHLLQGSVLVAKGDVVKSGQSIAKVGNSGNTSEPHLHIHCIRENSGNIIFDGKGVPMTFNNNFLCRNQLIVN